jgi:pimeloyl-ACP methyl ester carboxylesterase
VSSFNLLCPGQQDDGIPEALWAAIKAEDPLGATWGPPGGLSRYPIVPRFGWSDAVARNIQIPTLVLHGREDNVVLPAIGSALYSALPAPNKTFELLSCASHALVFETCSGEHCVDPHKTVQKRVGDWILTGK